MARGVYFRDDGYSGASLHRPGLDQLREQVSRAAFDRVVMTSPADLARDFVHQFLRTLGIGTRRVRGASLWNGP